MLDKDIEGFAKEVCKGVVGACQGCEQLPKCKDIGNKGGLICLNTFRSSEEQGVLDLFFAGDTSSNGVVND